MGGEPTATGVQAGAARLRRRLRRRCHVWVQPGSGCGRRRRADEGLQEPAADEAPGFTHEFVPPFMPYRFSRYLG
jgi:hypothetical protein